MKIFIERPLAVTMVFLALFALGVRSFLQTPLALAPEAEFPRVIISASWPGHPPEVVQSRVTAPIEEAAVTAKAVQGITSSSGHGISRVVVDFRPGADLEFARLALREELAGLGSILPEGVRPVLSPDVPDDYRQAPFLRYTVAFGTTQAELRDLVKKKIEIGLGSVKGVSRVVVTGVPDPEIRFILNGLRLKMFGLRPREAVQAVAGQAEIPATGRVREGGRVVPFRFETGTRDFNEPSEAIVGSAGGALIHVRDVAAVEWAEAEAASLLRIDGRSTVGFTVDRDRGANAARTARAVKARLDLIRKELPADLDFRIVDDESRDIAKMLGGLGLLAGLIAVAVFLMILFVLRRIAPSLLLLSSIAFSAAITFIPVHLTGSSLNALTLGAFALGFGMFVDNSIVVFENILRLRENGVPAEAAASVGAKEAFPAVLAATLTTLAVFVCFPFFQGRLKNAYLPLATVIGSALTVSLFVSFILIPAWSPRLIVKRLKSERKVEGRRSGPRPSWSVRHPGTVLLAAAVLFAASFRLFEARVSRGEWLSFLPGEALHVRLGLPPGTGLEQTDEAIRAFEKIALAAPGPKSVTVSASGTEAFLRIGFPAGTGRSPAPSALKAELIRQASRLAGLEVDIAGLDDQVYSSGPGSGFSLDSRISFFGPNLKKLKDLASDVKRALEVNPRVTAVRVASDRFGGRRPVSENVLKIAFDRLRAFDADPAVLLEEMGIRLGDLPGAPMRALDGGRETRIATLFSEADPNDLRKILDFRIPFQKGRELRLGEVAGLEERPATGPIDRENQRFQLTVAWEYRGSPKAGESFRRSFFAGLRLPPGITASLDREEYLTAAEQDRILVAGGISLALIFMILAAAFESAIQALYILPAVPLGLIGVFTAFILTGASFDSSGYIGVVLISGLVVNNAILIIDRINRIRKQGADLRDAAVEGARDRMRPILMTTGTTVFGLLPMLIAAGKTGTMNVWSSLALCLAGGLISSALLIFFVVPAAYCQGERFRSWVKAKLFRPGC